MKKITCSVFLIFGFVSIVLSQKSFVYVSGTSENIVFTNANNNHDGPYHWLKNKKFTPTKENIDKIEEKYLSKIDSFYEDYARNNHFSNLKPDFINNLGSYKRQYFCYLNKKKERIYHIVFFKDDLNDVDINWRKQYVPLPFSRFIAINLKKQTIESCLLSTSIK